MDWTELGLTLALVILIVISIYLGRKLLGSERMDEILLWIDKIVLFVEQTMKGAPGSDKLSAAQTRAVNDLKLDPDKARILIEAAVKRLFNMDRK